MELHNPILDENKKKVDELLKRLKLEQKEYIIYKDMLSNMWRIMKKVYKKTEDQLMEIDNSIKIIEEVIK